MESKRKTQIDRQLKEQHDRFQNERNQLEIEIRRLK